MPDAAPMIDAPPSPTPMMGLPGVVSTPTTFSSPLDVVPASAGSAIYFSAYDMANQAAIFQVMPGPTPPFTPTAIFSGAPLELPMGLAISADDSTIFIADAAANDTGGLFRMPATGGPPAPIMAMGVYAPTSVAVYGQYLVFGARASASGQPGLFIVPQMGGQAARITGSVNDVTAIDISSGGVIYALDALGGSETDASILVINGSNFTTRLTGLSVGAPSGIALAKDEQTLYVTANDRRGTGYVLQVPVAGGNPTRLTIMTVTPMGPAPLVLQDPTGLKRIRLANIYTLIDASAGNGTLFALQ
jgi:DNA-binding beta-propeller fold protein YncE